VTGEFAFIDWLRSRTPSAPRVLLGPGDDTAALAWPGPGAVLLTTDMLMDGTDFILADVGPVRVGRKAMAVNLSDIAAMAGVPRAALAAVALPRAGGRALAEGLYAGLRSLAGTRTPGTGRSSSPSRSSARRLPPARCADPGHGPATGSSSPARSAAASWGATSTSLHASARHRHSCPSACGQ
jgi:hypothetical protein